jgi:hypothetical protein
MDFGFTMFRASLLTVLTADKAKEAKEKEGKGFALQRTDFAFPNQLKSERSTEAHVMARSLTYGSCRKRNFP